MRTPCDCTDPCLPTPAGPQGVGVCSVVWNKVPNIGDKANKNGITLQPVTYYDDPAVPPKAGCPQFIEGGPPGLNAVVFYETTTKAAGVPVPTETPTNEDLAAQCIITVSDAQDGDVAYYYYGWEVGAKKWTLLTKISNGKDGTVFAAIYPTTGTDTPDATGKPDGALIISSYPTHPYWIVQDGKAVPQGTLQGPKGDKGDKGDKGIDGLQIILGKGAPTEPPANPQDPWAYCDTTSTAENVYIWDIPEQKWDGPSLTIRGIQGFQGNSFYDIVATNLNPSAQPGQVTRYSFQPRIISTVDGTISNTGKAFELDVQPGLRGAQGIQGVQGPIGPKGNSVIVATGTAFPALRNDGSFVQVGDIVLCAGDAQVQSSIEEQFQNLQNQIDALKGVKTDLDNLKKQLTLPIMSMVNGD